MKSIPLLIKGILIKCQGYEDQDQEYENGVYSCKVQVFIYKVGFDEI